MATSTRNSGYNVQSAVDAVTRLIVAHEVTNAVFDRDQLAPTAMAAQAVLGDDDLHVIADKGYFRGPQILSWHEAGITVTVPRPATSGNGVKDWFVKADCRYDAKRHVYVCPAGDELIYRYTREERGVQVRRY